MRLAAFLASAVLLLGLPLRAPAEEEPTKQDLLKMIGTLTQRNDDLERRLKDVEARVDQGGSGHGLTREEVRSLVEKMLADAKTTMTPGWLENLTFAGDLRLRYEYRHRAAQQRDDDGRGRYRLRFGLTKTWPDEDIEIGFRLATGRLEDPTSTNQTFEDMFQKDIIDVDTAYARWTPKAVKGLSLTAGKMAQPWQTTDMVWDADVRPEGLWASYRAPGLGPIEPFVGAGVFELTYNDNGPDATMAAYEAGFTLALARDVRWTSAVTHYQYSRINAAFADAAFFRANPRWNTVVGGRLNAGDFRLWDLTNKVTFVAFQLPWSAFVDWVHNSGNRDPAGRSDGLAVGLQIGQNKKKSDLSFAYVYRYVEADATLAFFTDETFGNTNRKGHEWRLTYNVSDAMTAGLSLYATGPIATDYAGAPPEWERTRFTLQADVVWRF